MRRLRDHGQAQRYIHEVQGYNYRMDGIQGAVLGVKLRYLSEWNRRRREHAQHYDRLLEDCPDIRITRVRPENESVYHLYTIRSQRRDELRAYLLERGIETGLHYPVPIHLQPAYSELGYRQGDFSVSEDAAATLISLPMFAELSHEQIAHVAGAVRAFHS
jgi:dTDP-4-amino-4,6-dideoxygalactose transaminase